MHHHSKILTQATTTPLASIFGSGFLVIVPILAGAVGEYAVLVMGLICGLAYLVGNVIRYNIKHAEPALAENPTASVYWLERSADIAIVLAYIISVSLYLNIMSAFVLGGLNMDTAFNEKLLTSSIIVFIVAIGLSKGLDALEKLEKVALLITLIVIALLIFGFLSYDKQQWDTYSSLKLFHALDHTGWEILTIIAGTLIVVQGFETPRFMGDDYPAEIRIRASRYAQLISTIVYIVFVAVAMPIVHVLDGHYDDSSLIKLAGAAAAFLVAPLVISAALSQFAAAVADTIASTGNMSEISRQKISPRTGYLIVGFGALSLTWAANTYEILALASRAFALYYLLQCLLALQLSSSMRQKTGLAMLALALAFIVIFAVPAG